MRCSPIHSMESSILPFAPSKFVAWLTMTRSLPLLVILAALSLQATDSNAAGAAVANSVVKVFSTMRFPDLVKPWAKQAPVEASGSGVVIEGHRILTNAHVVLYATQVQVQANE